MFLDVHRRATKYYFVIFKEPKIDTNSSSHFDTSRKASRVYHLITSFISTTLQRRGLDWDKMGGGDRTKSYCELQVKSTIETRIQPVFGPKDKNCFNQNRPSQAGNSCRHVFKTTSGQSL